MNGIIFPPNAEIMPDAPVNIQAEMGVLGGILMNNRGYELVCDFLEKRHFANSVNGWLYGEIEKVIQSGVEATPVTLKARVENAIELDAVGGFSYLTQILMSQPGWMACRDFGHAIRDAWLRRELLDIGAMAKSRAMSAEGSAPEEIIDDLEQALLTLGKDRGDQRLTSLTSAMDQAMEEASAAAARGDGIIGMRTGFQKLDEETSGLAPGCFYLLAGRPSMGKTGMGVGIAVRAAKISRKPILYWSGEMDAKSISARIISAHSRLPLRWVLTGTKPGLRNPDGSEGPRVPLNQREWDRIFMARKAAEQVPVVVDDRPAISVAQLYGRARRMARSKAGLGMIVVDYVGLMRGTPTTRKQGKYAEVSEISSDLLALAKSLNVPVLGLQQLNRGVEGRDDKHPTMADLRDSGNLEQDASGIFLLYRDHYYAQRDPEPTKKAAESMDAFSQRVDAWHERIRSSEGKAEIIIAKNRQGDCGTVPMLFNGPTTWFRDVREGEDSVAW
ncbi:replicative DNA helicase [Komagataeibacter intermedius]|uniref:replicative DNA helicase n=1 Tax=Komagataeibacter intermedius TaxID=66229 RepID=UPI003B437C0E